MAGKTAAAAKKPAKKRVNTGYPGRGRNIIALLRQADEGKSE